MIRFLLDLWQRWRLRGRLLFRYYDGTRTRWADPLRTQRELVGHPKLNVEEMAPFVDAGKEPEVTIFCQAVCDVFGVTRWDGRRGMTDAELMNLFNRFGGYIEALKKNTSPPPTSTPTSDQRPSPGADTAPESPPMSSPADWPSTPDASGSVAPTGNCEPSPAGSGPL